VGEGQQGLNHRGRGGLPPTIGRMNKPGPKMSTSVDMN